MSFMLRQVDLNGNVIGTTKIDMDKEEVKEFCNLFCDCKYLENNPDSDAIYVENYNGVSHGWICPKCKKFVQIG